MQSKTGKENKMKEIDRLKEKVQKEVMGGETVVYTSLKHGDIKQKTVNSVRAQLDTRRSIKKVIFDLVRRGFR